MITEFLKDTWSLFLGMAFLMLGNGLQGTLISWRANFEGFDPSTTGWIMTSFYIGFLAGSLYTTKLTKKVGYIRVFAAFASLASTVILIQILFIEPVVWILMRLLSGFCFAGIYVVVESWLNERSTNETRGQVLSFYMLISFSGLAGGQLLLKVANPQDFSLFLLTSIMLSLALIPILVSRIKVPETEEHENMSVRKLFKIAPAGVVSIQLTAIAQGSMFGMGAVYASNAGMTIDQTAIFMAVFIFVGGFFHWPLGWLSDRIDRRVVIVGSSLSAVVLATILFYSDNQSLYFIALFGLLGGFVSPIYSLSVAHTNDRLAPRQMAAASGTMVLLYGIGSALGPFTVGYALNHLGNAYFFAYIGLINLLGAIVVLFYIFQREAVPDDEQGDFQLVSRASTAVAMEAVAEEAEETMHEEIEE